MFLLFDACSEGCSQMISVCELSPLQAHKELQTPPTPLTDESKLFKVIEHICSSASKSSQ